MKPDNELEELKVKLPPIFPPREIFLVVLVGLAIIGIAVVICNLIIKGVL